MENDRHAPRYSPTALKTYADCAKKYECQYVDKTEVEQLPSPHLILGNALHAALAFLFRLPVDERSEQKAHQALRHFWAQADRAGAFLDEVEEAEWGRKGLEALSAFCDRYPLDVRPLRIEEWVQARLPNSRIVFGKVDRIDPIGDGAGVEVIDFKSGRCLLEPDELGNDIGARVYALATSRSLGQPVARVRFVYLTEGVERLWRPSEDELAAVESELAALTERIETTDLFVPRPGGLCRFCHYRRLCPAAEGASPDDLARAAELTPF
jgi:putative RecB family exonuclease